MSYMESNSESNPLNPSPIRARSPTRETTDKEKDFQEGLPLDKSAGDGKTGQKQVTIARLGGKSVTEPPLPGMIFDTLDELFEYYKSYGKQKGFAVLRKSQKKNDKGKVSFAIFGCSLSGKSRCKEERKLNTVFIFKTQCKARVCAAVFDDGKARVTSVILEHNHELCPNEVKYLKRGTILLSSHVKTQHSKAPAVSCGLGLKALSYSDLADEIEEVMPSNDSSGDKDNGNKSDLDSRLGGVDVVEPPFPGMLFDSANELVGFYKIYGNQKGFPIIKKSKKNDDQGRLKFMVLACALSGKPRCKEEKLMYPSPTLKTQCKAKVSATVYDDGKVRVTSVILEHNHELRPSNVRYFKRKERTTAHSHMQLLQNDQAELCRFGEICKEMMEIANLGSASEEKKQTVLTSLHELKRRLNISQVEVGSTEAVEQTNATTSIQATGSIPRDFAFPQNLNYNESFTVMSDTREVIDGSLDSRIEEHAQLKHKESRFKQAIPRMRKRKKQLEQDEVMAPDQIVLDNINGTSHSHQFSQGLYSWLSPQYYVPGSCQTTVYGNHQQVNNNVQPQNLGNQIMHSGALGLRDFMEGHDCTNRCSNTLNVNEFHR